MRPWPPRHDHERRHDYKTAGRDRRREAFTEKRDGECRREKRGRARDRSRERRPYHPIRLIGENGHCRGIKKSHQCEDRGCADVPCGEIEQSGSEQQARKRHRRETDTSRRVARRMTQTEVNDDERAAETRSRQKREEGGREVHPHAS